MEKEPTSWALWYLNEILLFLFSTGDGLFDGFRFSQDSLSFIQFVAALSIRHFLVDSRRQSTGKVKDGVRNRVSPGEKHGPQSFILSMFLSLPCLWNKAQKDHVQLQMSRVWG